MSWRRTILPEAQKEIEALDGSQRIQVRKAINKVSQNPLPQQEDGYGKPLGNKGGRNLTGLFKVKLRGAGLRIVYALERRDEEMVIVVVGARADDEVYDIALERWERYSN